MEVEVVEATQPSTEKIFGEMECLAKPDGSAKFSISRLIFSFFSILKEESSFNILELILVDDTIQICAIYGPGEVKIMKELADRAFVNVTYKPRIGNTSKLKIK